MRPAKSAIILAMLTVLVISASAAEESKKNNRFVFGIHTGFSKGLGWEFDWHYRSSLSDKSTLNFFIGGSARYDLSRYAGIQLDLNLQSGCSDWTFTYWNWPRESGKDPFSIASISLLGVLHLFPAKRLRLFVQSGLGGGYLSGSQYSAFYGFCLNLTAGLGVKIRLSKPDSGPAIVLGTFLQHLIKKETFLNQTADYLRFQAGYEF